VRVAFACMCAWLFITCPQTMANELLMAGADPNIIDDVYLQTPLHLSATHGHADIAAMMMAKRADAHLKDVWGNSFIDVATAVRFAYSR